MDCGISTHSSATLRVAIAAGWMLALLAADKKLEQQTLLDFDEQFRTKNGGIPVHLVTALVE